MFSLFTIISHTKLHVDIKYCFTEIKCIQVNTLCHCCHVYDISMLSIKWSIYVDKCNFVQ